MCACVYFDTCENLQLTSSSTITFGTYIHIYVYISTVHMNIYMDIVCINIHICIYIIYAFISIYIYADRIASTEFDL